MNRWGGLLLFPLALGVMRAPSAAQTTVAGQEVIEMTLERMVDLALSNSYRVRQLHLGIDRRRLGLESQRARLRSRVDLALSAPDFRSISENRWNSDLGINEIVHENSRRMEAELSVRQPVILFGYPTNGYLSLNNRVYRYSQITDDGGKDTRYYNRAFVRYTQPLFQPNELKNDLEGAELDLESTELSFYDDVVDIIDDVTDDYYQLFEEAYGAVINERLVDNLQTAEEIAVRLAGADSARVLELGQVRVEMANAREQLQQARSQFRLEASRLKTDFGLAERDSIVLEPVLEISPVPIDLKTATRLAFELTPRMRQLAIQYRENEINVDQVRGRGGVQIDLNVSYGREMQDAIFADMWGQPTNTYTIGVDGRIPIWDWGERKHRIEATRIGLRQTELRMEEVEAELTANVQNEIRNVDEYESRALAMNDNLALAASLSEESLARYGRGEISAVDLIQTLRREADTAENFLDAFLGWKRALAGLQQLTFYDFERQVPVLERFGIRVAEGTIP